MLKKISPQVRFIATTYLWGIFLFTLLRIGLLSLNLESAVSIPAKYIWKSFIIGLGFDTVISGYILILPIVFYFLFSFFRRRFSILDRTVFIFIGLLYSLCLIIICCDIPWFQHQHTRLTIAALQWTNTPIIMLGFIFEDVKNYPYLLLLLVLVILFWFILSAIKRRLLSDNNYDSRFLFSSTIYVALLLMTIIGIRGRIALKSPIRWGSAFVSEYNLTNQLALNPVYTFLQSYLDAKDLRNKELHFLDDSIAMFTVQNYYGIKPMPSMKSPIERSVHVNGVPKKYNVVLVLMESMTSFNMEYFGNKNHLTPVLDSLNKNALSFTNFYSDGIHTFCGIYSSLFGMPSLPGKHHMKDLVNQQPYSGIARTLSEKNYQTVFFTSHDDQFDNIGGFLSPNRFQKIISQKDFDHNKVLNVLGVPDHVLFSEAVMHINEMSRDQRNFFATILTSSNHGPFELPPDISFIPKSHDTRSQIIEYSDWSIGKFLKSCRQQSWYDSTIFIFTGDHGAIVGDLDMYLSFHHVPLIIYAPGIIAPSFNNKLGGQVDIYPTVMALLNQSYRNNSFGINLLDESRIFLSFSYDDEYGTISENDFYVMRKGNPMLFLINPEAKNCRPIVNSLRADSMRNYAQAIFQTHQWMIKNHTMN